MSQVNAFDVFSEMVRSDNKALKMAPLSNILRANYGQRVRGTQVTIGVDGNIIGDILHGKYVGGLILVDKEEFDKVKRVLESAKEPAQL